MGGPRAFQLALDFDTHPRDLARTSSTPLLLRYPGKEKIGDYEPV